MSTTPHSPITLRGGSLAIEHIRRHGLQASDIAVIPAAAGGPKGLILQALDQWMFGEWLPKSPRVRSLIGSSIGAWRMAAASMPDPTAAFTRLGQMYAEQTYPPNPSSAIVTQILSDLIKGYINHDEAHIVNHPLYRLHILTSKGRGLLRSPKRPFNEKIGFIAASLANLRGREKLAKHMERVVISDQRDPLEWLRPKFDAFPTAFSDLSADNLRAALLASGTLPLIMDPVRDIPDAPAGTYWDGGLIDYHLALPYSRMNSAGSSELVLYPHFTDHIVPGWLDKAFAWRRAHKGKNFAWLDNVLLVAPSKSFLANLPRKKLPDRSDFKFHGDNHAARTAEWKYAIQASSQLQGALEAFIQTPDTRHILPF